VARRAQGFAGSGWAGLSAACPLAKAGSGGDSGALPAGVALTGGGLTGAVALARSEAADPDRRVEAAERAAAAGALSEAELGAAYAAVRLAPALLARPLSASEKGARGRALVYQAMTAESQPAVRAELVRRAIEVLEPAQGVGAVALVPLSVLASLPQDATTAWLAPMAVRLWLAQGRLEDARPWLSVPPATPDDAAALARLWPLHLLNSAAPSSPEAVRRRLADWLGVVAPESGGAGTRHRAVAAGILALLQAAGEPVAEDAWARLGDSGTAAAMPSPLVWQTFQGALSGHRLGETVVAALLLLGEGGPSALPPVVLAQIVAGLYGAGLTAEARGLAREAVAALLE
jgi:hypothetical protein